MSRDDMRSNDTDGVLERTRAQHAEVSIRVGSQNYNTVPTPHINNVSVCIEIIRAIVKNQRNEYV